MNNPYEWLQGLIEQVPVIFQPLIVALAGAIPYIETEGAVAWGIIAGINPIIAAIAAASGNILCVVGVVFLGARIRDRVVAQRAERRTTRTGGTPTADTVVATGQSESNEAAASAPTYKTPMVGVLERPVDDGHAKPTGRTKWRMKLRRWMVKFGVPGASLLAPLALPTMLTAAFFVASGVPKRWVILWQVIAIVLWTVAVAILASVARAFLGW